MTSAANVSIPDIIPIPGREIARTKLKQGVDKVRNLLTVKDRKKNENKEYDEFDDQYALLDGNPSSDDVSLLTSILNKKKGAKISTISHFINTNTNPMQKKVSQNYLLPNRSSITQGGAAKKNLPSVNAHSLKRLRTILEKSSSKRSSHDLQILGEALDTVTFFAGFDKAVRLKCCSVLQMLVLEKGETVFEEGDEGSLFYVILEGSVGIYNTEHRDMKKNDSRKTAKFKEEPQDARKANMKPIRQSANSSRRTFNRQGTLGGGSNLMVAVPSSDTLDMAHISESNLLSKPVISEDQGRCTPQFDESSSPNRPSFNVKDSTPRESDKSPEKKLVSRSSTLRTSAMLLSNSLRANANEPKLSMRKSLTTPGARDESKDVNDPENAAVNQFIANISLAAVDEDEEEVPPQNKLRWVANIGTGAAFGEVALQTNQPRSATIITNELTYFAILERRDYTAVLSDFYRDQQRLRVAFLKEVPALSKLSMEKRQKMSFLLQFKDYFKGDKVVLAGDPALMIQMVHGGQFSVMMACKHKRMGETATISAQKQKPLSILSRPQMFGMREYLTGLMCHDETVQCYSESGSIFSILSYKLMACISAEHKEKLMAYFNFHDLYKEARVQVLQALEPTRTTHQERYTSKGRLDKMVEALKEVTNKYSEADAETMSHAFEQIWSIAHAEPDPHFQDTEAEKLEIKAFKQAEKERLCDDLSVTNRRLIHVIPTKTRVLQKVNAKPPPELGTAVGAGFKDRHSDLILEDYVLGYKPELNMKTHEKEIEDHDKNENSPVFAKRVFNYLESEVNRREKEISNYFASWDLDSEKEDDFKLESSDENSIISSCVKQPNVVLEKKKGVQLDEEAEKRKTVIALGLFGTDTRFDKADGGIETVIEEDEEVDVDLDADPAFNNLAARKSQRKSMKARQSQKIIVKKQRNTMEREMLSFQQEKFIRTQEEIDRREILPWFDFVVQFRRQMEDQDMDVGDINRPGTATTASTADKIPHVPILTKKKGKRFVTPHRSNKPLKVIRPKQLYRPLPKRHFVESLRIPKKKLLMPVLTSPKQDPGFGENARYGDWKIAPQDVLKPHVDTLARHKRAVEPNELSRIKSEKFQKMIERCDDDDYSDYSDYSSSYLSEYMNDRSNNEEHYSVSEDGSGTENPDLRSELEHDPFEIIDENEDVDEKAKSVGTISKRSGVSAKAVNNIPQNRRQSRMRSMSIVSTISINSVPFLSQPLPQAQKEGAHHHFTFNGEGNGNFQSQLTAPKNKQNMPKKIQE